MFSLYVESETHLSVNAVLSAQKIGTVFFLKEVENKKPKRIVRFQWVAYMGHNTDFITCLS